MYASVKYWIQLLLPSPQGISAAYQRRIFLNQTQIHTQSIIANKGEAGEKKSFLTCDRVSFSIRLLPSLSKIDLN